MRLRAALPAGVVDTGAAALATFVVQAWVVRSFGLSEVGVYSVFFAASLLAGFVPQFLLLYPVEVAALAKDGRERIGAFGRSGRFLVVMPISGAIGAILASAIAGGAVDGGLVLAFATTSALAAASTPMYAHFKNLLHLSHRSWDAARVSVAQLLFTGALLGIGLIVGVSDAWIPFTVIAAAQAAAVLLGIGLLGWDTVRSHPIAASFGSLIRSGRWLFVSGVVPAAAALAAAALVARLAGADELGAAQAAHVAARPVLVLAAGMASVLSVRSMESGRGRDLSASNRYWRVHALAVGGGATLYLLVAGFDWSLNPISALIPKAFDRTALVPAMIIANVLASIPRPVRSEFIGGRREPWVAAADSLAAACVVGVAALAAVFAAYSIPLGLALSGIVATVTYGLLRPRFYRSLTSNQLEATLSGDYRAQGKDY